MIPRTDDGIETVADPRRAFADPELRDGAVITDRAGRPVSWLGPATLSFLVDTERGRRVVRGFHLPVSHADVRFSHIVGALQTLRSPDIAWYRYLPDGLTVKGAGYPI